MFRILPASFVLGLALATGIPALAQPTNNDSDTISHGSQGNGWGGDLGGARNASRNADSELYYAAPVATGVDLNGPTKTQGPFAE